MLSKEELDPVVAVLSGDQQPRLHHPASRGDLPAIMSPIKTRMY